MQSEDGALFGHEAVRQRQLTSASNLLAQRIDHDVADEVDSFFGDAFVAQVLARESVCCEQQIRDRVCTQPVNLLRHGHIARAQARFDVRNTDAEFLCGERAGDRRVHVADDDHPIRAMFQARRSNAIMVRAVCSACEPEPTSRLMSGSGMPRSRKKFPGMFRP